jgi:hypothetical protein
MGAPEHRSAASASAMELNVPLPVLPCPACGALGVPQVSAGTGPHSVKASCRHCGQFLKWLPKALVQPSGKEERRMVASVNRVVLVGEIGRYGVELRYAPSGQTWPKHPLHQCGNNRLYSVARWGASTLSAQVRRATIAARTRGVAPNAPWVWGDRRSRIHEASTESGCPVVRQTAWDRRRRRESL